jgi:peptide chain release factor 2
MSKEDIQKQIDEIEGEMSSLDFWNDKARAQERIQKHQELKDQLEGLGRHDRNNGIMTIYAGAGGDDAEDFVRMLLEMYTKFCATRGWLIDYLSENQTTHGGYRNVSIRITGKNIYGILKKESGVHRLVRQSPFNSQAKRQTSFAMVEVIPELPEQSFATLEIPEDDIEVTFQKSGGPGGQNVNKRETAVRVTHVPTGVTAYADNERTQERNRDAALALLKGRIIRLLEEQQREEMSDLSMLKDTSNEWGNQMRSYVLHPYQMVKDHRSNIEVRDVKKILEGGEIDIFL